LVDTVFRGNFNGVTCHDNTINFLCTDDVGGTPSQVTFFNCAFRSDQNSNGAGTGVDHDFNWKNDSAGSTWSFYNCDFAKTKNAGNTGVAFYTNGYSTLSSCNLEHSDIGGHIDGESTLIGCVFGDCEVSGVKIDESYVKLINPTFGINPAFDRLVFDPPSMEAQKVDPEGDEYK